jgi:hypothetical protein
MENPMKQRKNFKMTSTNTMKTYSRKETETPPIQLKTFWATSVKMKTHLVKKLTEAEKDESNKQIELEELEEAPKHSYAGN